MQLHAMRWIIAYLVCMVGVTSGYVWGDPSHRDYLDVAIIGGGVGGTYTGYRLRNRGLKISVFEYTNRIGGRMFTAELPHLSGTTVDFGAMRFIPQEHTSLVRLINELKLPVDDFPLNFGNPNETLYYLRGKHLRADELGGPRTPYDLRPDERLSPGKLLWKLFTENTNMSRIRYPPEDELYTIYTTDGYPLYTMTLDSFYARYASREAYNYIRDARVWDDAVGQFGAHLGLRALTFPTNENKYDDLKTIRGGMSRLPKTLLSLFLKASQKHKVYRNYRLLEIEGQAPNYKLRFAVREQTGYNLKTKVHDKVIYAKKIVLAVQRDCVEKIYFLPFRNTIFKDKLNSVIDVQAQKIFLAYREQWWKKSNSNITHVRSDLGTKFTYDWRSGTGAGSFRYHIHLPSYSDGSNSVALWRQLQSQGGTIYGSMPGEQRVSSDVRDRIHSYMSKLYRIPESHIPPAIGGGMQLWDRFPFKAAWHYYKPCYRMEEVRDFMLRPYASQNVFIVGNSWWPNDLQSWSESALRMVELLMCRYFK